MLVKDDLALLATFWRDSCGSQHLESSMSGGRGVGCCHLEDLEPGCFCKFEAVALHGVPAQQHLQLTRSHAAEEYIATHFSAL